MDPSDRKSPRSHAGSASTRPRLVLLQQTQTGLWLIAVCSVRRRRRCAGRRRSARPHRRCWKGTDRNATKPCGFCVWHQKGADCCCCCAAADYQTAWLRTCRCLWPSSLCSISLMKRWVPLWRHLWTDSEVHVFVCALSQTESGAGEGGRHVGHHHQTRPLRRNQEKPFPSIQRMLLSDLFQCFYYVSFLYYIFL